MSDIIGDLESVSFKVATATDKVNAQQNIETHFSTSNVSMVGPDKLVSRTKGDRGNYVKSNNINDGFVPYLK